MREAPNVKVRRLEFCYLGNWGSWMVLEQESGMATAGFRTDTVSGSNMGT